MKNDQRGGRIEGVLDELRQRIKERYPEARFRVAAGPEDPQEVHLVVTVDLDDPDEVLDVVMERMLQVQLDEELPVYVSPRRTPQRRAAVWAAQRQRAPLLPPTGSL
jgi:hypothetical protein